MLKLLTMPCEVRGVRIRNGFGCGLNFKTDQACVSIGSGKALCKSLSGNKSVYDLRTVDGVTATATYFRGGLSGLSDSDTVFIVLGNGGKIKIGEEITTFADGCVLDLTQVSGKYTFEMSDYAYVIKLDFSEVI